MFEKLKTNSFIKRIGLYFVGNLSSRLLSVLLVPIYAYFVTADNLGEYDYIGALASIISPIIYFAIWEAVLRFCMMARSSSERNVILSNIITFSTFISVISFVCIFFIYCFHGGSNVLWYTMLMVIVQGLVSVWQYSARSLGHNKQYVIAGVTSSAAIIIIDIVFSLIARLDYKMLCISYLSSQIISIIILEYKTRLIPKIKIKLLDYKLLRKFFAFTIPLVINNVSLYFYNSGSKIIIKQYIGSYENGLYSFASKFSLIISLFSTVLSMAVVEESYTYKTISEYKDKMGKILNFISKGYFCLILLALPSIYILYTIAFVKTEYYQSSDYIFLLLLSALFSSLSNTIGSAFLVTNKTKYISITTISGAAFSLLVSILFVERIGIYSVLIGNALGTMIMMVERFFYAKKSTGLSMNWKLNILISLICFLEYIMLILFKNLGIQLLIFVLAIFCDLIFYKRELKKYIK